MSRHAAIYAVDLLNLGDHAASRPLPGADAADVRHQLESRCQFVWNAVLLNDTERFFDAARMDRLRLAIVANTDRSIMEHTLCQLEVAFDEVIVAEDARAYKPSRQPFQLALDTLGEDPENVLHVAFGFKYDIGPAQGLGFKTAWVNRHQEPAPGSERPDHEWRDLWGLAELAESQ